MEEMDGSVYSAIWVGLGGREMLNFEGSGCMDVSGKWKTEGMIMNGKRDDEVGGDTVGSTDPEMILWGPQILRCQGIYIPAPN